MGKKWWVIKVWWNGVHTSSPVEMGQKIMREVANQQQEALLRTKHMLKQQSWRTKEWLWVSLSMIWVFALVRSIQDLGCHKVCVQWVPRALSEDHKVWGMFSALSFLLQYVIHGHDFLKRVITGDWTWVHHHSLETQHASVEWKPPWSPWSKKFKMGISAGKVMSVVFWDHKGVLLVDFMEKSTTINAVSNCATLEMLWAAIKWQCPGLLTAGVLLLHNNARLLVATATQQPLQHFRWTVLEHAPYSPHLVQSDFHLVPTL